MREARQEESGLERLEAEIAELWERISSATYRFVALVGEFDRREGWAAHGLASCAQWLTWQCGIGEVAAREKVRVARALESLPQTSEAFRHGRISYSKVRAITRVAKPEDEAALLDVAERGTAADLERLLRRFSRLESAAVARANALHRNRVLYYFHDEDGSLVIHARLPPETGAIVQRAIEEAVVLIGEPDEHEPLETRSNDSAETLETQSNDSAETNISERGACDRDAAAPENGRPPREPRNARQADALRLMSDVFLSRQSDASGSVADRYQVVVHVDQRLLSRSGERGFDAGGCSGECELEEGEALAVETVRRLACDASLVGIVRREDGEPLNVGRKTRSLPPALQRALKVRDRGCRFPGCGRRRYTEGHHVKHWADGGETSLENTLTLCSYHHRLVHEGRFGVSAVPESADATDDGAVSADYRAGGHRRRVRFVFTRPDGTRIEPVR